MRRTSRTSFVSAAGDMKELKNLYESLEAALWQAGFARDTRQLTPHITLGRDVVYDASLDDELKAHQFHSSFTVSHAALFESARIRGRMVYNMLHKAAF
ncbi:RNA 2',3'-cyclic phosphodiesterase [bioreactor metagenome]|uniref:RNA 2',3'-cyclic phosphodiesterase n=1 Tax=bioreactor metagenome TaxID=1076179 RepID=A0A645E8X3_9ZZZZ